MSAITNTIDYIRARMTARAAGYPVSLTTDPAWLVNMAINRRAGWPEDRHAHGSARPNHRGGIARCSTGDAQAHLWLLARAINTPRLVVRVAELGEWREYLMARLASRITTEAEL